MPQDKKGMNYDIYIPMVFAVAFLIGCLSVALVGVREHVPGFAVSTAVSPSDAPRRESTVRMSDIRESGMLRYRMVSAADIYSVRPRSSVSSTSETPVSSEIPVSSETTDVSALETVSSAEKPEEVTLDFPNDHYINFVPPEKDRVCYLTFDDGPSENTDEILDILDYYNVKATFFVIYHEDMEDQYRAIVDQGHTIALHTYTHDYKKVYRSEKAFFNEINRIDAYVYRVTGVHSKIIRFPGGSSNTVSNHYSKDIMQKLKQSVPARGYVYHDWNVDSEDAAHNNLAPEKLLANVKKSLTSYRKPDVLMHDGGETKRTTVEALPAIIEYAYSQGYTLERLELDSYAVHHDW